MFFKFFDHIYSQISLQKGDANLYFHQWDLIITISLQLLTTLGCSFRFLTLIPNIMHAHIKNKHNKATQQYKFIKSKGGTSSKEPTCQCRRLKRQRFSPWVGKLPGGRHSNRLQYSRLENRMDSGAWQDTVHGVAKSWTRLKRLSTQERRICDGEETVSSISSF